MRRTLLKIKISLIILITAALISGCSDLRPSRALPVENQSGIFIAPTMLPTPTMDIAMVATPEVTQVSDCSNDLRFLEDLSFPDGTQVNPGKKLEKEWQVRNTGSCNWNEFYTVRLISGDQLGAEPIQALVPARNGADAVIRIEFTAPAEAGRYTSTWQAYGPEGDSFGEWFSMEIVVTSQ